MRLFGTSGIRGVYPHDINHNFAYKLGLSFTTYFKRGYAVVGYDCRKSSQPLALSLVSGILDGGFNAELSDLTSTPAFQCYIATNKGRYKFGTMVTASHNPPEYNGFKLYTGDGLEAYRDVEVEIEKIMEKEDFKEVKIGHIGKLEYLGEKINDKYVNQLMQYIEEGDIKGKEIIVDLCGCSSVKTIPKFLKKIRLKHKLINNQIDGLFKTRPAEPRPDNIIQLIRTVKASNADFGVAFDGDGDRAIFVDEKGVSWWGDLTGILIGKYLVETGQTKYVVTPITSTAATEIVIEEVGGRVVRTKVGGKNIVKEMIRVGSKWGFEENGGGIYAPHIYGRDGGITLIMILKAMKYYGRPLSQLLEQLPKLYQVKDKVRVLDRGKASKVIEEIKEKYDKYKQDTTEGVKIFFKDYEWVLVRLSGTEPIIRIFAESNTRKRARELVDRFKIEVSKSISS